MHRQLLHTQIPNLHVIGCCMFNRMVECGRNRRETRRRETAPVAYRRGRESALFSLTWSKYSCEHLTCNVTLSSLPHNYTTWTQHPEQRPLFYEADKVERLSPSVPWGAQTPTSRSTQWEGNQDKSCLLADSQCDTINSPFLSQQWAIAQYGTLMK